MVPIYLVVPSTILHGEAVATNHRVGATRTLDCLLVWGTGARLSARALLRLRVGDRVCRWRVTCTTTA